MLRQNQPVLDLGLFKSTFLINGHGDCQLLPDSSFAELNLLGYNITSIWVALDCIHINFGNVLGGHLIEKHHEHVIRVSYSGKVIDSDSDQDLLIAELILPQLELVTKLTHTRLALENAKKSI
ncbi:hypothetical protein [Vibrio harveyi]|uniref:hypothetical protein n=1 Tax=Vibrio harveyi TaxID=669 RepID=UPI003CE6EDE3